MSAPMGATVPYLDGERLSALLTPDAALSAIQDFYAHNSRESVAVPTRIHLHTPGPHTIGLYMPAATSRYIGVKIVHLMPDRFPSVEAEIFLYEAETGKLLFWGDGKPMTARRTAAVSTAASLKLHPECRRLTLFGAGVQAAAHADAFAAAYPGLERIWAVTRSMESYGRLAAALTHPAARANIQPCHNPQDILGLSDCVITATPAAAPLFDWGLTAPGTHVVGVGSATPAMNELPPAAFLEGRVWLDTPAAIEEAGDLQAALKAGWKREALQGDLFDLLSPAAAAGGKASGNDQGGQRSLRPQRAAVKSVFKSVGHAAQDLAVLIRLWELMGAGL